MKRKLKEFWLKAEFIKASRLFRLFYRHHHRLVWGLTIISGLLVVGLAAYLVVRPSKTFMHSLPLFASNKEKVSNSFSYSEFDLLIPSIDVFAPVVADVDGYNQKQYRDALKKGVAHFNSTAKPGEDGNVFIFGHSTDWQLVEGNYQTVFKNLPDLKKDQDIILQYKQKRYYYKVLYNKITAYDDMTWIGQNDKDVVTLMTCYPIGSNEKRMIVRGKLYNTTDL